MEAPTIYCIIERIGADSSTVFATDSEARRDAELERLQRAERTFGTPRAWSRFSSDAIRQGDPGVVDALVFGLNAMHG